MHHTIFLDVDGVLANWMEGAARLLEVPLTTLIESRGSLIDERSGEFWYKLSREGTGFYGNLNTYPWSRELYETAKSHFRECYFLTAVPNSGAAQVAKGKLRWLQRFTGNDHIAKHTIICPSALKSRLAGPGRLLVDDRPSITSAWEECGGTSIRWPEASFLGRYLTQEEIKDSLNMIRCHGCAPANEPDVITEHNHACTACSDYLRNRGLFSSVESDDEECKPWAIVELLAQGDTDAYTFCRDNLYLYEGSRHVATIDMAAARETVNVNP